ncbi:restriction endonuclease [Mycobacterium sp. 852002-51971_SCH5477799-a]|uniref:restriction endonuclease n=1 Tax=Mycobacterium sp. 852002-51971_SCH5477799-a TaxID=1834106 RepID=UPI0007FD32EB|nr:restriction endonuclease [Mycobacterium sp. 852002-51971_SCH5477799-a]OBF60984.1 restriction endonuclease [Mycobacterium sp. 852002-51971_SCH5477799-a]
MEKMLGSLLVLGLALPWYFTQQATGSLPAGCLAGLGGLAVAVAILWWLSLQRDRYQAEAHRRRDLKCAKAGLRAIDRMSGTEFEEFVAAQLRIAGYSVAPTASTGDYGVDLIAKKDGVRMAVQCKRLVKAVGVAAVQQVVAGALHHGCNRTVVVTNQTFTKAARQLASTHRCRLVGRSQLQSWTRIQPIVVRGPRRIRGNSPHVRTPRLEPE